MIIYITDLHKHMAALMWVSRNIDPHLWRYDKVYHFQDYDVAWKWEFSRDDDALMCKLMFT